MPIRKSCFDTETDPTFRSSISCVILGLVLVSGLQFPTGLVATQKISKKVDDVLIEPLKDSPSAEADLVERHTQSLLSQLKRFGDLLLESPSNADQILDVLATNFKGVSPVCEIEDTLRRDDLLDIFRGIPARETNLDGISFSKKFSEFLAPYTKILTAEFEILGITANLDGNSPALQSRVLYDIVGRFDGDLRQQLVGEWQLEWVKRNRNEWRISEWKVIRQMRSVAHHRLFADVSFHALGKNESYPEQLLLSLDHWRTVLDSAVGITVHGNHGISVGDIDTDGDDDLYVCQPAGLPNRLFRNNGDGTFEDITHRSGTAVLDDSPMALFADLDNDGDQDLIVISSFAPLLFLNEDGLSFRYKQDAFQFLRTPRATFTSAALADYDRDGYLDVYLCSYGYHLGTGTYQVATPYHDANNGPPNFLFRNRGDATFVDVTHASGMDHNNRRFSFAASWEDYNRDGWPDLYVANDFGRNNLYQNNRDGKFTDVASRVGVEDVGAGMSVSWLDYDRDGWMDLYVGDMWSAAGLRLTAQSTFQHRAPPDVREMYQRHAKGNSLFRNRRDGTFEDVSFQAMVEKGRWAWSSDAVDFDNDGYEDLYIANGMVTGSEPSDLENFFWSQVAARSPLDATPSYKYEAAWATITNLLHEDYSWNGGERNVFYLNNGDGTFSDVSGTTGLDFRLDSRSFAAIDVDHDGDLDLILKSRNAPGVKVLRNDMGDKRNSVSFRLRGKRSNRDAVGARVTVFVGDSQITKAIRVGTGFLSQHSKDLMFGLGKSETIRKVRIDWPSGIAQELLDVPVNHKITVEEDNNRIQLEPFRSNGNDATTEQMAGNLKVTYPAQSSWLIRPLPLPELAFVDLNGRQHQFAEYRGSPVLLNLWALKCPSCPDQLELLQKLQTEVGDQAPKIVSIVLTTPDEAKTLKSFVASQNLGLDILVADQQAARFYNAVKKYLFNRRTDMTLPTSFLLNAAGAVEKVYQGSFDTQQLLVDTRRLNHSKEDRFERALPFPGHLYVTVPQRDYFRLGVALSEEGLLDSAVFYFQESLRANPADAAAQYNIGTLYMEKGELHKALRSFRLALELEDEYAEAHNNMGVVLTRLGRLEEAMAEFEASLRARSNYLEPASNLAALYARTDKLSRALDILEKAFSVDPENLEITNNLGILYAKKGELGRAETFFLKALAIRPDHPDASNNLALVYAEQGKSSLALERLLPILDKHPDFEKTYLVLATLYTQNGDRKAAAEILQKLLRKNPDHESAKQALRTIMGTK